VRFIRFAPAAALVSLLVLPGFSAAAAQKGEPAPPLSVTTTSGQPITLANYRGRVLLLDFFATWCTPCREAVPHLVSLNKKYGKQGLQVLGLAIGDADKDLKQFASETKLSYPVAAATEALASDYGVFSIPTLVLIGKKGTLVEKFQGLSAGSDAKLEGRIRNLLAE
jgi:cytochrome c biogenesis protein CcmG, thiol:disulfide interchange protein DsbE